MTTLTEAPADLSWVDLDADVPCRPAESVCGPGEHPAVWFLRLRCPRCQHGRQGTACEAKRRALRLRYWTCESCLRRGVGHRQVEVERPL